MNLNFHLRALSAFTAAAAARTIPTAVSTVQSLTASQEETGGPSAISLHPLVPLGAALGFALVSMAALGIGGACLMNRCRGSSGAEGSEALGSLEQVIEEPPPPYHLPQALPLLPTYSTLSLSQPPGYEEAMCAEQPEDPAAVRMMPPAASTGLPSEPPPPYSIH